MGLRFMIFNAGGWSWRCKAKGLVHWAFHISWCEGRGDPSYELEMG